MGKKKKDRLENISTTQKGKLFCFPILPLISIVLQMPSPNSDKGDLIFL